MKKPISLLLSFLFTTLITSFISAESFDTVKWALSQNNRHLCNEDMASLLQGVRRALFNSSTEITRNKEDIYNYLTSLRWTSPIQLIIPPSEYITDPCLICEESTRVSIITPCCNNILCKPCFFYSCLIDIEKTICTCCDYPLFAVGMVASVFLQSILENDPNFIDMQESYFSIQEHLANTPAAPHGSPISSQNFTDEENESIFGEELEIWQKLSR